MCRDCLVILRLEEKALPMNGTQCGEERGRAPIDFGKRATGKKIAGFSPYLSVARRAILGHIIPC